jgi:hypothetical protein
MLSSRRRDLKYMDYIPPTYSLDRLTSFQYTSIIPYSKKSMRLVSAFTTACSVSGIFAAIITGTPRQNNNTDYKVGPITLDTPWTNKVGTNPWQDYPRPRLQRSQWKNLNGVWRYRNAAKGDLDSPPFGQRLENPVLVPFCLESALSGT